jgi:hypothetical protein
MVPRRQRSWFSRLGSIAGPERVGAALVVLTVFGEGRVHSNRVEATATESRQVLRARVIRLENRTDSLNVRARYLERQVRLLRRGRVNRAAVGADLEPYGPSWQPEQRGTLLASIGRIFHGLTFWMRDEH